MEHVEFSNKPSTLKPVSLPVKGLVLWAVSFSLKAIKTLWIEWLSA